MIIATLWIISIVVGSVIGSLKNRGVLGFFLTVFLSWFGVIIIALMPKRQIAPSMIVSQHVGDNHIAHTTGPDNIGKNWDGTPIPDITSFEEGK
jgi:hypothetical protein